MEEPWIVTCARCGRRVAGEKTRLFWSTEPGNKGTFRICADPRPCNRRMQIVALSKRPEFLESIG